MTESGDESRETLAERIAAHTKLVHRLLRIVDPYLGSNGDARAEMHSEERIDGALQTWVDARESREAGNLENRPRPA
jgi:hypothetical protein